MSAVVQVGFDFLAEVDPQPIATPAPRATHHAPARPTREQALRQMVSLLLQLLPGFACVNAEECGSVTPDWNPAHAANLAERGIGMQLLCAACIGRDIRVQMQGWTPPLLMRRTGQPPAPVWSPDGELIQAPAWEEVEAWSGELQSAEWRSRHRRSLTQPSRALLTAAG